VHIQGERRFKAPPAEVFRALTDPAAMEEAFEPIDEVEAEGDEWQVRVRAPLPGGFKLKFSVRVEELREPEHARLRAWGKSLGGRVSVDSNFDLEPDGDGTHMRWQAEVDAAGLFSGLGSQALGPVATHQADRAMAKLAERLDGEALATAR
jgi:carbon monoxide dehydrogenase subunit G